MKVYLARLFLASVLSVAALSSFPMAVMATPDDLCPTIDGEQTVDICVPPSKPHAKITKICVNDGEGKARLRLKNNGDTWTETFSIYSAGFYREIHVKPGEAKTRWIKRLTPGKMIRVTTHGVEHDRARIRERKCR